MDESERIAAIAKIVGPCPGCESPAHRGLTVKEQMDIIAEDAKTSSTDPELNETVRRMDAWCNICIKQHEQATGEAARQNRIDVLKRRTYRQELIPESGKIMRFDVSNRETEKPNEEIFDRFREGGLLEKNIWIHGEPGTSKTFLGRCILNDYLGRYHSAGEIGAMQINEIGRGFHPGRDIVPFVSVNLLLIEDIDKANFHPDGLTALWTLIDKRATENKRIIITSNQTVEASVKRMKQSSAQNITLISSLLERLVPMERIEMTGPSARR